MDDLKFLLCFVILGEIWLFLRGVSESVPLVVLLIYSLPTSFPPSPGANRNTGQTQRQTWGFGLSTQLWIPALPLMLSSLSLDFPLIRWVCWHWGLFPVVNERVGLLSALSQPHNWPISPTAFPIFPGRSLSDLLWVQLLPYQRNGA